MPTCVRTSGDLVQEAPTSSTVSSGSSAHKKSHRVDEGTAGSPAIESCTPCEDSPTESESDDAGSDPYEKPKPAKRKRYSRKGCVEFKIYEATSFEGGYLQAPILLDTKTIEGVKMMRIRGREKWLCQAAHGWTERRGPFQRAVLKVKKELVSAIAHAVGAVHQQKIKAAAAGRELLNLGAASDSSSSSEKPAKVRKPKVVNPVGARIPTIQTVEYRGEKFKAFETRGTGGGRVYVEAKAAVASIIVGACLELTVAVIEEETKPELEGPATAPPLVTDLEVDNPDVSKVPERSEGAVESEQPEASKVANPNVRCVRYDPARSCYEVIYRAEIDGVSKQYRSVRGLYLKRTDKAGKNLSPENYKELMSATFEKAKKLWNELDQSKQARF